MRSALCDISFSMKSYLAGLLEGVSSNDDTDLKL